MKIHDDVVDTEIVNHLETSFNRVLQKISQP